MCFYKEIFYFASQHDVQTFQNAVHMADAGVCELTLKTVNIGDIDGYLVFFAPAFKAVGSMHRLSSMAAYVRVMQPIQMRNNDVFLLSRYTQCKHSFHQYHYILYMYMYQSIIYIFLKLQSH